MSIVCQHPARTARRACFVIAALLAANLVPTLHGEDNTLTPAEVADGWKLLFNGKDLMDWEGRPEFWSVEDGAITGKVTAENNPKKKYTSLVWKGGQVADFALTCKFKITNTSESGGGPFFITFRGWMVDPGYMTVGGYDALIDSDNGATGNFHENQFGRGFGVHQGEKAILEDDPDPKKTAKRVVGSVGDANELRSAMVKGDWNDYRIVAVGNHFQLFVNGRQTVDALDQRSKVTQSGLLALQFFWSSLVKVQFKDIKLKELHGGSVIAQASPTGTQNPASSPQPSTAYTAAEKDDLEKALLAHPWSWKASGSGSFPWTKVVFWRDGTMTTSTPTNAQWTIVGPRSVALHFGAIDPIVLTFFKPDLDYFTGCREDGKTIVSGRVLSPQDTSPAGSQPAGPSQLKVLSDQFLTAKEWVLARLDLAVPRTTADEIATLKATLAAEAALNGQDKEAQDTYKIGIDLCDGLSATLKMREQAYQEAGGNVVRAPSANGIQQWENRTKVYGAQLGAAYARFAAALTARGAKPFVASANAPTIAFPRFAAVSAVQAMPPLPGNAAPGAPQATPPPATPVAVKPPPPPPPPAPEKEQDPIVGRWRMGRDIAVFSDGGGAERFAPNFHENGRWKLLSDGHYDIDWSEGRVIQRLALHDENNRLMGKDGRGQLFLAGVRVRKSDQ